MSGCPPISKEMRKASFEKLCGFPNRKKICRICGKNITGSYADLCDDCFQRELDSI